jgi:hypothetical protein
MPLPSWLAALFGGGAPRPSAPAGDPDGLYLYFRCKRCGEVVRVRANRRNDVNREDEGPGAMVLRKEVMGNKCYQLMSAEVWLDSEYRIVDAEVSGGELVNESDYEAQQAAAASDAGNDQDTQS